MLEISRISILFVNTVKKDCCVRWPSQNRDHHKFMAHCCKMFVLILNNKVLLLRSYSFGNSGHMLRNPKVADRDNKNLRCKDQSVFVGLLLFEKRVSGHMLRNSKVGNANCEVVYLYLNKYCKLWCYRVDHNRYIQFSFPLPATPPRNKELFPLIFTQNQIYYSPAATLFFIFFPFLILFLSVHKGSLSTAELNEWTNDILQK